MKKFSKRWGILLVAVGILIVVGLREASAQQYFFFQGKVENLYKDQLTVKGNKGETMYFAIGRNTVHIPSRMPGDGERVRVTYFMQRDRNVASQIEILPPPPAPKTTVTAPPAPKTTVTAPPAPHTTVTAPPEQEAKEKKSTFGCSRGCSSSGSGEKK
jgi:hypothetical protein